MVPPTLTRILAAVGLGVLISIDVSYHVEIAKFMTANAIGGIISCAVAALAGAILLRSLISGQFTLQDADQKWMAVVLFIALLIRYSLVSFFSLTPSILLFVAVVVCLIGLCRSKRLDNAGEIRKRDLGLTMHVLFLGLIFGLYLILAASGYAPKENAYTVERTAMGWALAYFGVLFIVGFLFAYPRTLQGDPEKKSPYEQRVNTNLEQISDWLTKIIVGLGLVELKTIPGKLTEASTWMAQSFAPAGPPPASLSSFCTAFIVLFSVLGFLAGHLCTRMFLSAAFYRGDQREVVPVERQTAAEDPVAKSYLAFIANKANADKVDNWLTANGQPTLKASDIVAGTQYAELRKRALDELAKS